VIDGFRHLQITTRPRPPSNPQFSGPPIDFAGALSWTRWSCCGRIWSGRWPTWPSTLLRSWPALVKTRLKRMQYRPPLLAGFLANTGLDLGLLV